MHAFLLKFEIPRQNDYQNKLYYVTGVHKILKEILAKPKINILQVYLLPVPPNRPKDH